MGSRFVACLLLVPLLVSSASCGSEQSEVLAEPKGRMLIVATPSLAAEAWSYAEFREQTGYLVETTTTSGLLEEYPGTLVDAVAAGVAAFASGTQGDQALFVLLMGDADVDDPENPDLIPVVSVQGATWTEVGDSPYGDLDSDGIPDLAIGRIPFREPAEVEAYRRRVQEHEANYKPGPWNKTISAFAGEGGFGDVIDGLLEMAAGWVFDEMSYDFDMTMTYAASTSSYYLPYSLWEADYVDRYQAGAVLTPYIGHTAGYVPCCEDTQPNRRGMLAFFSCDDGAFQWSGASSPYACLAEEVLLRPHGPVVSLGASSISHPYGNAVLPRELGHAILDLNEGTYGQALTRAKFNMVHRIDDLRLAIDAAAEEFVEEPLGDLIDSHVILYSLLGDPAVSTLLPPGEVRFDTLDSFEAGQSVLVRGRIRLEASAGDLREGEIRVTLETIRSVIPGEMQPRDPSDSDPQLCLANHTVANEKVVAQASGVVNDSGFEVQLNLPVGLPAGRYHLKGYAQNDQIDAIGSEGIRVE